MGLEASDIKFSAAEQASKISLILLSRSKISFPEAAKVADSLTSRENCVAQYIISCKPEKVRASSIDCFSFINIVVFY